MSISFRDVEEILRIIDEFPVAEIRFEHHDLKLYVRRESAAPAHPRINGVTVASPAKPVAAKPLPSAPAPVAPAAPKRAVMAESREGLVAVTAPVSGTFYAAPSPGAPPFVAIGQQIKEGDDLFIIEVMKLMNFVKAPVGGTVVSIEVENAEPVQQEQPMMWIKPGHG